MAGDDVIAVGLLATVLGIAAPAAKRDAPVFTPKRDGNGQAVGRKWQISACRDQWTQDELKHRFQRNAIRVCVHAAHVGDFIVEDDLPPDHETHRECRIVRLAAEVTCRWPQR